MTEIIIDCPVCENEIAISEREIKLAVQHKNDTAGKILVSCPECCRVLDMGEKPDGQSVSEWIGNIAENPDDWCGCVPMLDPTQEQIPNGYYADLGVKFYRPGSGGPALKKRPYMLAYGINPECHLAKNPSMGGEPFHIGK